MIPQFIVEHEGSIRLAAFLGVFAFVAAWEALSPRRRLKLGRGARWPANLGLLVIDFVIVRAVAPGAALAVAFAGEARGWGLLNSVALAPWLAIVLGVVLLDLGIYVQHVMFHAVPTLWRLHRVHHADLEFDVTTGVRFHPVEILLSTAIKCAVIAATGAPVVAVAIFEVLLNTFSMFNHANASLPAAVDRGLRWLAVTPDMHRVHHSMVYDESSSNFGFHLSWWDRIFGTYKAQPAAGHEMMAIGVDAFRDPQDLRLDRLLVQPFRDTPGHYPINRREQAR